MWSFYTTYVSWSGYILVREELVVKMQQQQKEKEVDLDKGDEEEEEKSLESKKKYLKVMQIEEDKPLKNQTSTKKKERDLYSFSPVHSPDSTKINIEEPSNLYGFRDSKNFQF